VQARSTFSDISLVPLGAGDLIDRAARFYRRNFKTFLFIAAPPVIIGTIVSVGWRYMARELFSVGTHVGSDDLFFYYAFVSLGTLVIWFTETVATMAVMGGASRNFVRHLLFGEEISFKATYKNTWARVAGLVTISSILVLVLGFFGLIVLYIALLAASVGIVLIAWAFAFLPAAAFVISLIYGLAVAAGSMWLFFLIASRFAFVPQVMLVEGRGAVAAIGRSSSLASGSVNRLVSLFLFTFFATYSALALLYVPLLWYAWVNGIDLIGDMNTMPASFEIMSQLVGQMSFILLSPVWTIGLCLLYIDERVRHEGYDIELAATRRVGEIPDVPPDYINPLQPALVTGRATEPQPVTSNRESITTLGLGR